MYWCIYDRIRISDSKLKQKMFLKERRATFSNFNSTRRGNAEAISLRAGEAKIGFLSKYTHTTTSTTTI